MSVDYIIMVVVAAVLSLGCVLLHKEVKLYQARRDAREMHTEQNSHNAV